MIEIYWLMHSKDYAWMSAQYVVLHHVFKFWFSYDDPLESLSSMNYIHIWDNLGTKFLFPKYATFPPIGGGCYSYAWCWKSQHFLASWFLVIIKMKIHWLNTGDGNLSVLPVLSVFPLNCIWDILISFYVKIIAFSA